MDKQVQVKATPLKDILQILDCYKEFESLFLNTNKIMEEESSDNSVTVNVSYLEIYNEKLRDLLDPPEKQLKIFSTKQTGVSVKNLSVVFSDSYEDIVNLLADGKSWE